MKKISTIIGARPQFVKASSISRLVESDYGSIFEESIIHTGQHFDNNMSKIFFDELDISPPKYNLNISGGSHGSMTGKMLEQIELILIDSKPDIVLVYGDTNTTLAGALAAVKLHIPVVHIEAGLRSFNRKMPEEINRILTDKISSLLCCPTNAAVEFLKNEGICEGVTNSGDVMYDVALYYKDKINPFIHDKFGVSANKYVLCTIHRAENTDDYHRMKEICYGLSYISQKTNVILPLHPRTKNKIKEYGLDSVLSNITVTDPLPYHELIALEQSSSLIITDSGGVQKEAYFFRIPCLTIREETEWIETLENSCNRLVEANSDSIFQSYIDTGSYEFINDVYGDGFASKKILDFIDANL